MNRPYLTADLPGIGGRLKVEPEDFFVQEIPLYSPVGEGQHIYVEIEKKGLSTYAAIRTMARALNISSNAIGHAGLKDARAITRQTLSIDNVPLEAVKALKLSNIKILTAKRHHNKLKIGHLAGNHFVIRVRDVKLGALPTAEATLAILTQRGVPNYFGEQRFGNRGNTGRLGELLIKGDVTEFVAEHLGRPQHHETQPVRTARQLVDEGRWAEALARWPNHLTDERQLVAAINRAGGRLDLVFKVLNRRLKGLFVSAFQSQLFNALLAERLDKLDQLEDGDVAYIHAKGASFIVQEAAVEQSRADTFELSPSGPLFGSKTLLAQGKPGHKEHRMLTRYNLSLDDFKVPGLKIRGARRPYRFKVEKAEIWWDAGLMVSFKLQPGAYATSLLAEIMKN